ncbi:LysR family transcriptional regulator [Bordetella bronchiseptica]|uniref:LysR family transcriptional regulator n=1 Tax=Bordetella bronchiseptica TaxID=518 RepID=UPI00028B6F19|nr:LysR family transcriptional regulator [Bordetella bronchiseptica]KDC17026.1 LysR substrate-binding domain protein [Bordetella bronchiseptica E014]KDC67739.1 LysR substrate-binding domain protein [Bordetella bronchiseptica MBORD591]KDC91850.1 LysR substrate-binding domain protein [Bordetella bronchiseptica MBORD675]CCJ60031.1 LysR-type transcriptional regulator [Bordetella bronchiseptica MO149]CCN06355.1 LysR-type transcriptional regulator [Bordetella bronchiseptica Bbr77]
MQKSAARGLGHIRIKHLRLLELVVQYGSLRKAAEGLHLSEPAASQMLREVESTFGVTLFERGRRGMRPNPFADVLVGRVRVILRELHEMQADVAELEHRQGVSIDLGALPRCLHTLVPTTLVRLFGAGFRSRVRIAEGTSRQLLDALDQGAIDIAVTRLLESHAGLAGARNFDSAVLYEEAIAIVCSTDHPLSAVDTVTLDMLTQYDWVLPPSTSITGKLIEEEFVSAGLRPPVPKVEWLTSASRLTLVQKSNFLGICPASVAAELQQGGRLHVLPVNPRVPLPPISVVWRRTKGDIAEIMDMKNALIECAAAMPGAMEAGAAVRAGEF